MSTHNLRELQERLLSQNHGSSFESSWSDQTRVFLGYQSTSRSLPDNHFMPPLLESDEPNCVQKQTDYLRNLTENAVTDDYLQVGLGPSMQSSLSSDQTASILEAMTSGQEFPGSSSSTSLNTSSGFFDSSLEMLSSSSVPSFGDTSGTLGISPETSNPFQAPPIVIGAGIVTASGDRDYGVPNEAKKRMVSSGSHEVSDLVGVNPFNAGAEIDIQQYMFPEQLEVVFCDLENRVFEKHQSRKDKQARQRIINGKVKFLVRSDRPVKEVDAWVRREAKAAKLEKDINGMVSVKAVFLKKDNDNLEYQVDLDSVYKVDGSDRPVYKLAKVHTQERNQFELLVQVVFTDNEVSAHFKSKPFLIKTKRINDEPAEPAIYSKEKRKRPNTCPGGSSRWSPQGTNQAIQLTHRTLQNEPDSTGSLSPLSACSAGSRNSSSSSEGASHLDDLVVKHLKAQQASIDKLSFGCMMQTSKGDIAYHLKLTNPDMYQILEEGVVVGFFPNDEGMATIEPLSNENAPQAVMAGVISRSAYVEAHAPLDREKEQTDIVCVIGMVKVQIVGSVRTGERIYASTDDPGTGIPETHLPLGAFMFRNHTLLGMAMETCKPRRHGEVNLVKCFVCIVLGINSHQLSDEVKNIMENIDMDINVAIGKSNRRTCRRMFFLVVGLIIFLGLLGFFMYQLLTPGTAFRYYLCRMGSRRGPHLSCSFTSSFEELSVRFIPFNLQKLKEKIPHGEIKPKELNRSSVIYFLNYDRCAYGGCTDGKKFSLEKEKTVRGPTFLASYGDCNISSFVYKTWEKFNWTKDHPGQQLECTCNGAENLTCRWIVLLLSSAACFLSFLLLMPD